MPVITPAMMKSHTKLTFIVLLALISGQLSARGFQIREQNPLALIHGLPLQGGSILDVESTWSSEVLLNVSNATNLQIGGSESLIIDGETAVLDLLFHKRTSEKYRFGLHVPLVQHSSGGLDNFIENYHDALGLPPGDRDKRESNQFLFQYIREGVTILDKSTESSGLGDIRILADRTLKNTRQFAITAHASIKFPSGDSEKLTGSGAMDFSGWLTGDYQWNNRWHSSWHTGLLWMGQGDVLPDQQNDHAYFLGGSLAWELSPAITLQIQTDWHSALYEQSDLKLLGPSLSLTTGGRIKMGRYGDLAIAVLEDIDVGSAPDVQLHLGWYQAY